VVQGPLRVDFLTVLADWISDPARWTGATGIPNRLLQHLGYSVGATLIAAAIALPLGIWLGHTGRYGNLAIQITNVGRAVPTLVLILLLFALWPFNVAVIFAALVALAVPPILANAYVGIRQVDPEVRDAALGMGMRGTQLLREIEIPVAIPLIMSGVRTSAVQIVATAGLAAFVGFGGLGRLVIDGVAKGFRGTARGLPEVVWGAVLIAALAVLTELLLARVQRAVTPRGLRRHATPASEIPSASTT